METLERPKQTNAALIHTIYVSRATEEFSDQDILELLAKARKNNAASNVTGMLLFHEGNFFQILEGEEQVVQDVFDKISNDPRHTQVTRVICESVAKRSFGDWTMGFVSATNEELNSIDGTNDFFSGQSCLLDVDIGRAKKLLRAFADGRWQAK